MKLPLVPKRSDAILLVDQGDPTPRFLVASYDQKQLVVLMKGQLVRDQESTIAQQLRARLDEESISCTTAAFLLSRPTVEFFSGSMPPAEEHELPALVENFVVQEADESDDRVIDFVVTGGDNETTTDVLAMTCDQSVIADASRQFKDSGFKLIAATYVGFGSVQLIHQVAHQKLPITIAITSSDTSTEIAVLQQRQPVLFRTIQRGVEPGESYASALAAEIQRTLAFIGAGDEDSALIYLMGRTEDLGEVAEVMSETVSSSVTITGVLDRVDYSAVEPFDDSASYAQLIGVASAIHQDRLTVNFLSPRKAPPVDSPWQRIGIFGGLTAAVLAVFGYIGWSERAEQMDVIQSRQNKIAGLSKRVNQAAELQDIVDSVVAWQRNDITWLDELKDLSDRFPERNESLVRKMVLSAADDGRGVVNLSVQVNSPEVITELESAIRDSRHQVNSKRVTEIGDSEELTWSFDTTITFQPLPRPKNTLPEPIEDVTVDGVALDAGASADAEPDLVDMEQRSLESTVDDANQQRTDADEERAGFRFHAIGQQRAGDEFMNQRTRLLLIAMIAIGVLLAGDWSYRTLIAGPRVERARQIEQLDTKIRQATDSIVESDGASEALNELERLSLPYDPELARARYQDWLLDLVQSVELTGASVDAGKPTPVSVRDRDTRKPKEIFLRYAFSLRGRGTLQQVSRFLHHFYQAGHLHKISSMTLNPVSAGRMIDFTASIEALGLNRCERKEELSGESVQRLASSDFSNYQSISRRNLFGRHGDDTLSRIVLSAITIASDGTAQAWFAVGDGETQVLERGESLAVTAHMIDVIDIVAGQVLLDVNGRVVTLTAGESIENPDQDDAEESEDALEAAKVSR